MKDKDNAFENITRDTLIDLFKKLPLTGQVLDVGCGYGRDLIIVVPNKNRTSLFR